MSGTHPAFNISHSENVSPLSSITRDLTTIMTLNIKEMRCRCYISNRDQKTKTKIDNQVAHVTKTNK